jgi:hypothetical protein
MQQMGTARARTLVALAAAALLAFAPAAAHAVSRPQASATVLNCAGDHLTVVGKVALTGRAARKARGAGLQVRFQALALFGLPRIGAWRDLGAKTTASDQQVFTGLPADGWAGLVSWRYKKGATIILSGDERSRFCTLAEGVKPVDATPPRVYITPQDEVWHHGPSNVRLVAQDDFSGVRGVKYTVDGGPVTDIRNGGTFTLDSEGAHNVQVAATDVAGNIGTLSAIVRVDMSTPTKPQLQRPLPVTASTTPAFRWTPSTDSGSGIKGYFLVIKRGSDGTLVSFTPYDSQTTSVASPQALTDGETYTASVVAIDNTDDPFTSESDPLTFKVDTHPKVTATDPAPAAILSGARKDGNLTLTLDRAADPATVTKSTVVLTAQATSASSSPNWAVTCSNSCTTIVVDPSGTLPEGRYTLTMNGVKSQEAVAFPAYTLKFAVAFYENPSGSSYSPTCPTDPGNTTMTTALGSAAGETIVVGFDYTVSGTGSGELKVNDNGTIRGSSVSHSAGSGHDSVPVTLGPSPPTTRPLIFELHQTGCGAGNSISFTASNVIASRTP